MLTVDVGDDHRGSAFRQLLFYIFLFIHIDAFGCGNDSDKFASKYFRKCGCFLLKNNIERFYDEGLGKNFYLQNIQVNFGEKHVNPKEDTNVDKILKRNRAIFQKKYETTTLLLGISGCRRLPKTLNKDVMGLIARFVFHMHPLDAYLADMKMNVQNSITF